MEQNRIWKQAPYFTKQNLGLVLGVKEDNLNYRIKKWLVDRTLISLKKGFYISSYYLDLVSQDIKKREAYFEYLANILRYPSYVSLEYVLANCGFLPETVFAVTSVTTKTPRRFASKAGTFSYSQIKKEYFGGYQLKEFKNLKVRIASPAKALFDFLYLKNQNYLQEEDRFNWGALTDQDRIEFKSWVEKSGSAKMQKLLLYLKKKGII